MAVGHHGSRFNSGDRAERSRLHPRRFRSPSCGATRRLNGLKRRRVLPASYPGADADIDARSASRLCAVNESAVPYFTVAGSCASNKGTSGIRVRANHR